MECSLHGQAEGRDEPRPEVRPQEGPPDLANSALQQECRETRVKDRLDRFRQLHPKRQPCAAAAEADTEATEAAFQFHC